MPVLLEVLFLFHSQKGLSMKTALRLLVPALALVLTACVKPPTGPEPPAKPDSCCHGTLVVLPYDSVSGDLLVGASVRVQKQQGDYSQTKTVEAGGAVFTGLCPGTYALRIAREHCAVRELTVTLECNESAVVHTALLCESGSSDSCCHGVVSVVVTDSLRHAPASGVVVRIWRRGNLVEQHEARQGVATFDGLCPGEYVLEVVGEGYVPKELPLRLECNDRREVHVLLSPRQHECCEGVLEIVVRDSSEEPVVNALVRLWRNGAVVAEARTDSRGVVRFAHLCKGVYGVSIHHEDYLPKEFQVELGCNQALERRVFLESRSGEDRCCSGALTVLVLDAQSRQPLAQAMVRLWVGNTVKAMLATSADGKARFEHLCAGTYALSVHRGDDYRPYELTFQLECNEQLSLTVLLQRR